VSAAASSLPSHGIYVVANERVRGVPTPLKRAEGVIRGQEKTAVEVVVTTNAEFGNDHDSIQ
jgi:hypothetical protein